jgi:hypothetical protein
MGSASLREMLGATRGRLWPLRLHEGKFDLDCPSVDKEVDSVSNMSASCYLDDCQTPPSISPWQLTEESSTRIQKHIQQRCNQKGGCHRTSCACRFSDELTIIFFIGQVREPLIGARVLPGLGRRLYGWKGGWRGWRRGRRRHGVVATREEEGGGALEAADRF